MQGNANSIKIKALVGSLKLYKDNIKDEELPELGLLYDAASKADQISENINPLNMNTDTLNKKLTIIMLLSIRGSYVAWYSMLELLN